jgi:Helix-turn-helix domain
MRWKECHIMDERLRFVARLLEGEKMAPLCAEFGISRKTGYKIYDRYQACGVHALNDRSRRPGPQGSAFRSSPASRSSGAGVGSWESRSMRQEKNPAGEGVSRFPFSL